MNKAQKRTWWTFAICLSTLVVSAVVLSYLWVNETRIMDFDRPMRTRLLLLPGTIPLIMIVILSARYPTKSYDERDIIIEHKAAPFGYVAAFMFLTAAGLFLRVSFCYLVYLTYFVGTFVSSIASLVQYYRTGNKSIAA